MEISKHRHTDAGVFYFIGEFPTDILKIKNVFFSNEVYVMDMEGLQEKSCIFDLEYEDIQKAFEERLIYID